MKDEGSSAARKAILARIRAAQGRSIAPDEAERETVHEYIRARPQGPRPADGGELVACFRERVLSLASTWDEVGPRNEIPAAIASYLRRNNLPLRAVCWEEFIDLDWAGGGMKVEARSARGDDLVGITGAFCAIAETGTLMMTSGPRTPAAASLLPETHIAVVNRARIVRGMEDAWALLRAEFKHMPRAVNFISGPSRTADIEQTVTLGAHGPYRVHIILADGGT